jgi:COMPASS component SPP1
LRPACTKPCQNLSKFCSQYCGVEFSIDKLERLEKTQGIEPIRFYNGVKGVRQRQGTIKKVDNEEITELKEEEVEKGERLRLDGLKRRLGEIGTKKAEELRKVGLIDKRLKILKVSILRWEELFKATMSSIRTSSEGLEQEWTSNKKSSKSKSNVIASEAPCGFDRRIIMSDELFKNWIETDQGKYSMVYKEGGVEGEENWICLLSKKKCVRHEGWKEIKEADWEVEKSVLVRIQLT